MVRRNLNPRASGDTSILPRFRTGDFAAGIKSGAEGIARALGGGAASPAVAVTPSVPLPVAPAESAPAKSAWDEVLNQYRRRTDLIPNLAETVKAYAPRENAILDELAAARASAITPPIKASPLCSPSLKRPTTASPSHGATTSMPPGNRWCPRRRSWNSPRRRPRPMPGQQAPLRPRNQSQQNRRRRHSQRWLRQNKFRRSPQTRAGVWPSSSVTTRMRICRPCAKS